MKKFSLINIPYKFEENDIIVFEMPSFCSGVYEALVKKDPDFGLYIYKNYNYFKGCRDYEVIRNGKRLTSMS